MERQVAKIFLGGVLRFRICLTSSNPIPRLQPVMKTDLNCHEESDAPRAAMLIDHFTVVDGSEVVGDFVLIQTFLLYYVNQVILMLTSIFQEQFP